LKFFAWVKPLDRLVPVCWRCCHPYTSGLSSR